MGRIDAGRLASRVDGLLERWRQPGVPGVAVAVTEGGVALVERHAGLASLELGVPVGPGTCFRIASVSKQFTTAAIHLLAAEGRLDIDAPARRWLPELADFGTPLTISHFMHNVSGLRDMLEIMRQGGVDLGFPVTREQLLDGVWRQRTLNFMPGSRYLYCNTGFMLLGLIVERVSGEPLPDFLARRIFRPLGMSRTRMTPSPYEPVPGLATGYLPAEGGWVRAAHAFPLGGEGGLVSCTEDLARWERNYTTHQVGGAGLAEALQHRIRFNRGGLCDYACGIAAGNHRGQPTFNHGGLWPGYKTEFLRVPGLDLAIFCISNDGGADPYHLAHDILDALLDDTPGGEPKPPYPPRGGAGAAGRAAGATGRPAPPSISASTTRDCPWAAPTASPSASSRRPTGGWRPAGWPATSSAASTPTGRWRSSSMPGLPPPTIAWRRTRRCRRGSTGATPTPRPVPPGPSPGKAVSVAGPVAAAAGPWAVEAVEGDDLPPLAAGQPVQGLARRARAVPGGRSDGLHVTGNRARQLVYARID